MIDPNPTPEPNPAAGHKRSPILPKDVQTGPIRTAAGTSQTASTATRRWGAKTLAVVFGLLFAYDVWEGVDWLVLNVQGAASLDTTVTPSGWVSLVLVVVAPVILFLAAFLIARRRAFLLQIVIYVAAWAAASALYLSIVTLFSSASIIA